MAEPFAEYPAEPAPVAAQNGHPVVVPPPAPADGSKLTRRAALAAGGAAAAVAVLASEQVLAAGPARRVAARAGHGAAPTVSASFATTLTLTNAFGGLIAPPLVMPADAVAHGAPNTSALFNPSDASTWLGAAAFAEWANRYPKVTFRVLPSLFSGAEGGEAPLLTQLAGGTAPDIFPDYGDNPGPYAAQGTLADLSPFAKTWPGFTSLAPFLQGLCTVGGKIVALPSSPYGGYCIAYRKDMFAAAGVAAPTPDWTMTDFINAAKRLSRPAKKVWGTNLLWQYTNWFFSLWAESMGVPTPSYFMAVPNEAGTNYAYPAPSELAKPLAFYQELVHSGAALWGSSETFGQITNDLLGGRVAMAVKMTKQINGLIGQPGVSPAQIGIVPWPIGPSGLRVWTLDSTPYSVNATVTGTKLELAWDLLSTMLGPQGSSFSYAGAGLGGAVPGLPSPYAHVTIPEAILSQYPAEWLRTLNSPDILGLPPKPVAATFGIPPYTPGAQSGLDPYIQKALTSPQTPAIQIATEAVNSLTPQFMASPLPGLTKDKWHAYYRALGAFFQKYYPQFYATTYTQFYKRYETW